MREVFGHLSQSLSGGGPHDPAEENHKILCGEFLPPIGIHAEHIVEHVAGANSTEFAPATAEDRERLAMHIIGHVKEWLVEGHDTSMGPPTIDDVVDVFNKRRPSYRGV